MVMHGNVAKHYKKKQVESASPGELIVMLYDGAIDRLNKAELALQTGGPERIEKYHNALVSCQEIITELTVSLDMEKGGEIAKNLFRLYDYMNHRLVDANIKKDLEPIDEVKKLLANLRSAWIDIVNKEKDLMQNLPKKKHMGLNLRG